MGCQKIKTIGWIVFEIIDGLAGSETYLDLNKQQSKSVQKLRIGCHYYQSVSDLQTIFMNKN